MEKENKSKQEAAGNGGENDNSRKQVEKELTDNEYSFCVEYIRCGKKPSQAYKKSSYTSDNMTAQTIATKAYELLQKGYIRDMIQFLEDEVKADIKQELKYDLQWTLNKIGDLAQNAKTEGNRLKALEMLMKHNGGYKEDNDQKKQEVNIPITNWVNKGIKGEENDFDQAFNDLD